MGWIINIVLVIVLGIIVSVVWVNTNPQQTKVLIFNTLKKFVPDLIDVKPKEIIDNFIDKLPRTMKEIINKNPSEVKDFEKDVPFQEKNPNIEILGRPRKVVEFFCTNDFQCKNYFLKSNSQCELASGICFISV